jgi:hypothetical protein
VKIKRNKNRAGRLSNMVFGLIELVDALVCIASFGFLHTTFCLDYARHQAMMVMKKQKS